jgi:hypothetical protein
MNTPGLRGNSARIYPVCLAIATLLLFVSISPAFGREVRGRNGDSLIKTGNRSTGWKRGW